MRLGEAIAVCTGVSDAELKRARRRSFIWQPAIVDQGNLDLQHDHIFHHDHHIDNNTLCYPRTRQSECNNHEQEHCFNNTSNAGNGEEYQTLSYPRREQQERYFNHTEVDYTLSYPPRQEDEHKHYFPEEDSRTSIDIVDECHNRSSSCTDNYSREEELLSSSMSFLHSPTMDMATPKFIVGYALITKKIQSFLQPSLIAHARSKGIVFTAIERSRPLDEQGPFDVILHKISGDTWYQQLKAYKQRNPEVIILDHPEAIKKVYNRQSMLQEVSTLNFRHRQGRVEVPKQLVVNGDSMSIADKVSKAGLKFPLVAKPLWIDGTAKSHALSLVFNESCLSELSPPLVLQEFVNHGGVLFKVYNFGDIVRVSRRFSLPDVRKDQPGRSGVMSFPRVSCAQHSADGADLDPSIGELPPKEMLESLCRALHCKLGLNLFNLDMIRENGRGDRYYVIDINYFPGYGKLPEYEKVFTEFLSNLAEKKHRRH